MLAYTILFNALGALCTVAGLVIAVRGGGGEHNVFDTKWVRAGGAITFVIVGAFMIYLAAHDPFGIADAEPTSATTPASEAAPPVHLPSTSRPPHGHADSVFRTNSGNAYCATYLGSEDIGCVIKAHEGWSKDRAGCHYLYVLHADGSVDHEACPDEDELANVMFGLPPVKSDIAPFDDPITLGTATCTVNYTTGTTCRNAHGGFRLDRHTKPKIY